MMQERLPQLRSLFLQTRALTSRLVEPLTAEDCNVQSSIEVSPPKWHLAHTTWFFEKFILEDFVPGYRPFDTQFSFLFNSYYHGVGAFHPKFARSILSRPSLKEVLTYRADVDESIQSFLSRPQPSMEKILPLVELGIHHEQQHQELLMMDIKHNFAAHPLRPLYRPSASKLPMKVARLEWKEFSGGLREVGHGGPGFSFDNEKPRHQTFLTPFRLANRLITNEEFLAFIDDKGYERAELWLSEGWDEVKRSQWSAPLYWEKDTKGWQVMTLGGMVPLVEAEPVCHVSYFEADAFARWSGKRLPTESEWEIAASDIPINGNFLDSGRLQPSPGDPSGSLSQMWGDVWEWTSSSYSAYPGYRPLPGVIGEYNGKFMVNQQVLRGGCAVTPLSHIRASYRNFYPASSRWQFSGIRLAEEI